ncbi:DUF2235 domain-containing protein [Aminobacter sp. Piv2-1]|uniref:DUF2235 domain-containing protein n=1 Tax=Aminobacter sp. Piv2-1 TaxID=3031122 RepID=UPI0030976A6F
MESPLISTKAIKKRLAIFLDGTWNSTGDNTNVWRLKSLCADQSADGAKQCVYYDVGVNGFRGGTFGKGVGQNVVEAYKWLIDEYEDGDEIFIFGFSRGAYTARSLAGFIAKCGLIKSGAPLGVDQIFERYQRPDDTTVWQLREARDSADRPLEEQWILKYAQAINIKLLGVWDTVGALGVPAFNIPGISRSTLGWLHTGLRLPIEHGFHALAIDEHRGTFSPTLWTTRKPHDPKAKVATPRSLSSVEQRWFCGAHANVGGGYRSDLLAQIPLRWIMQKASAHGLTFRNDVELDGDATTAPIADSYRAFLGGGYALLKSRYHRIIAAPPDKRSDGIHSTVNETIDKSVFDRWRTDPHYRPESLSNWAKRFELSIEQLNGSVHADKPDVKLVE